MEMPVMDGNTATVKIRELERSGKIRRHVPIMGISANARPEQVAKMTEVGMVHFPPLNPLVLAHNLPTG